MKRSFGLRPGLTRCHPERSEGSFLIYGKKNKLLYGGFVDKSFHYKLFIFGMIWGILTICTIIGYG